MTPRSSGIKTVEADSSVRKGRLAKARQFLRVADEARALAEDDETSDASTTLYVHAGIAASDALCVAALGKHAHGSDHQQAVALLALVDKDAAGALRTLLGMKTRAGYGHDPIGGRDVILAERDARLLVAKASA